MPIASDFQMDRYSIPKLFIEVSPDYVESSNDTTGYFAKSGAGYENDHWVGEIMLGFRKTAKANPSDLLYEIIIIGKFSYSGKNDEDSKLRFNKFLHNSGAATLIPIARAALVTASTLTGHSGLCSIPNINVFEIKWNALSTNQPSESETTE